MVSGLLILPVIGIAVFFVSRPKEGSVEWHKRECIALYRRIGATERPWIQRAKILWERVSRRQLSSTADQIENLGKHQRALVKLGHLEQEEFVLSNRSIDDVVQES